MVPSGERRHAEPWHQDLAGLAKTRECHDLSIMTAGTSWPGIPPTMPRSLLAAVVLLLGQLSFVAAAEPADVPQELADKEQPFRAF